MAIATRTRLSPRLVPLDTEWVPGTPAQLDHPGALRLSAALLNQTRKVLAHGSLEERAYEEQFLHSRLFATIVEATTELSVEQARERLAQRFRRA